MVFRSVSLFIALLIAARIGFPTVAGEEAEPGLARDFAQVARMTGKAYSLGRDLLERHGAAIIPFLQEKVASPDWAERDLARALIFRIEHPEKVQACLRAFPSVRQGVSFPRPGAPAAHRVNPQEAQFGSEAVPVIQELLRETDDDSWEPIVAALARLADPDSAPALLYLGRTSWRYRPAPVHALVSIGKPALPVLREAIRTCPTEWPDGKTEGTRRIRAENWQGIEVSARAARAIGMIGDPEAVPLLIEKLEHAVCAVQVEAFSDALGRMRAAEGAPAVFAQLVRAATIARKSRLGGSSDDPEYAVMRECMRAFGPAAAGFLKERRDAARPVPERAIAAGLLAEIERPEEMEKFHKAYGEMIEAAAIAIYKDAYRARPQDAEENPGRTAFWRRPTAFGGDDLDGMIESALHFPAELVAERACAFAALTDLRRVAALANQVPAFDILADALLLARWNDTDGPAIAVLLAGTGDQRAIGVYGQMLGDRPARYIAGLVEAMLLLGSEKAVPLLEEIIRRAGAEKNLGDREYYQRAEPVARAVLPALQGDAEAVARLLQHEDQSVREAAARHLARKGDLRALPVLTAAAAGAEGDRHRQFRDAILSLGRPAIEPLVKLGQGAADWRQKLVCEALALRLSKPEVAERFDAASRVRHRDFASHGGPGLGTYRETGRTLAEAAGEEAIPLIEAAAAFDSDFAGSGSAIFALAELKQERSIPVIVGALSRKFVLLKGGNLAAAALEAFGEKGIEAAKAIPAPDPAKENYASRAGRHRGATETLTLAEDVKGVENVLEALALPIPDRTDKAYSDWQSRTERYLKLAKQYRDQRLIEPVLNLLEKAPGSYAWDEAIELLAEYDDPRIVPVCARYLQVDRSGAIAPARDALVKRLGKAVLPFLLKTLAEAPDDKTRAGAARALGELASYGYRWRAAFEKNEEQDQAAAEARGLVVEPLIAALADRSEAVQQEAAEALVLATSSYDGPIRDRTPVEPLASWLARQAKPSGHVVNYLVKSKAAAAGPAILSAYRASGRKNAELSKALASLGYAPAIPDISQALDARLAANDLQYGIPELDALNNMGAGAAGKVKGVFADDTAPLRARVAAAAALSREDQKAFEAVQSIFEELADSGPWDHRLAPRPDQTRRDECRWLLDSLAGSLLRLDAERARPPLLRAMLTIDDAKTCDALARRIESIGKAKPELKALRLPADPAAAGRDGAADGNPPELPFLQMCDLWRRAESTHEEVPEAARNALLDAGDDALAAMVELCYPPSKPLSAEEVDAAVAALADEGTRPEAVRLLALRFYSPRALAAALAARDDGTPRAISMRACAAAVRAWRAQGPWFLDLRIPLLRTATTMVEMYWPIESMRKFAISHLDRLAEVQSEEWVWDLRPLGALLASVRYSPDPAERVLLSEFLMKATPAAKATAQSVIQNGLSGRWRPGNRWGKLPPYREGR